jgi:hypothetical protein
MFRWELGAGCWEFPNEQALDHAAGGVTPAEQAGRKDAGVVQDEEIAPSKVTLKIGERGILELSPGTAEFEQSRSAPFRWRFLCDQFLR